MVGSAVDTIVWSSDAISITSISAANTGPTRCPVSSTVAAEALTAVRIAAAGAASAQRPHHPHRKHPGAAGDVLEVDVLIRGVCAERLAGAVQHRRGGALMHQQPHV